MDEVKVVELRALLQWNKGLLGSKWLGTWGLQPLSRTFSITLKSISYPSASSFDDTVIRNSSLPTRLPALSSSRASSYGNSLGLLFSTWLGLGRLFPWDESPNCARTVLWLMDWFLASDAYEKQAKLPSRLQALPPVFCIASHLICWFMRKSSIISLAYWIWSGDWGLRPKDTINSRSPLNPASCNHRLSDLFFGCLGDEIYVGVGVIVEVNDSRGIVK